MRVLYDATMLWACVQPILLQLQLIGRHRAHHGMNMLGINQHNPDTSCMPLSESSSRGMAAHVVEGGALATLLQ